MSVYPSVNVYPPTSTPLVVLMAADDTDVSMIGTNEVELKNFRFVKSSNINVAKMIFNFSMWVTGGTGTLRIYIDDEASPRCSVSTTSTSEVFFYREIYVSDIQAGVHVVRLKAISSGNYEVHQKLLEAYGVLTIG